MGEGMNNMIIVTRHPAVVVWLRENVPELADAPILTSATRADVAGRHVYGVVPLDLADAAWRVSVIAFDRPPRGAEYSVEEMRAAGARLMTYTVVESSTIPIGDLDAVETAKILRDSREVQQS
jgi:hypothetical protein